MDRNAFLAEHAAFRAQREAALKAPDSWLTLAGLFWLEDGSHTLGSDPDSDLLLPASAPAHLGTLEVTGDRVLFRAAEGEQVLHEGTPVQSLQMEHDADSTRPATEARWGDLMWTVIQRGDRLAVRLRDNASPVRTGFSGIPTFDPDPAWRREAWFEPYAPPRQVGFPTVLGTEEVRTVPGALAFEHEGQTYRLDAAAEPGDTALFVVFEDATSRHETYGGGRFLYAPLPDPDGRTVLDFNRAYNPPCSFTPFATCPRPTEPNRLPFRVTAGERYEAGP